MATLTQPQRMTIRGQTVWCGIPDDQLHNPDVYRDADVPLSAIAAQMDRIDAMTASASPSQATAANTAPAAAPAAAEPDPLFANDMTDADRAVAVLNFQSASEPLWPSTVAAALK